MELQEKAAAYEFDAPSHIIDFSSLDADDNADEWFDQVADPNAARRLLTPKTDKPLGGPCRVDLPRAVVSPRCDDSAARDQGSQNAMVPSNVVTSWGNAGPSNQNQRRGPSRQPRRLSKRMEAARRLRKPPAEVANTPPIKKPRRSAVSQTRRRSLTAGSQRARRSAMPKSSVGRNAKLVSSEQQEVERMQAAQKEVAEQCKKNEASFKAAVLGSQPARKPVLSTTVPLEFHFRTDERLKRADAPTDSPYKELDFASQLRKNQAAPANGPRGATVPKPFNLTAPAKRKHLETDTYVSMAEQIVQFQKRTPARYHLRSRQREAKGPSPVKNEKLKITHPQTPQLMKRPKMRTFAVKSSAEAEEEELEKIRQFKFKALELNKNILEGAAIPKKPAPKEPTQQEPFHLETDRRIQERQASRKPEEPQDNTFHSRPVPLHILEDVVGVPLKKVQNPTVPESPAFSLKNRVRIESKVQPEKPVSLVKANPMPHFGLPFQPKRPEKSQVEVCPFSFHAREQERQALKEKRLEELRNEELPKFKALPLPDFSEVHLPEKKVAAPTQVEPFQLQIDQRGAAKSERWEKQIKEELKQQMEAAEFKARPNVVVYKEPFLPKKENRSIVDNSNFTAAEAFQLHTERRAKERLEFDRALCEKEALRACMEEARRKEEEEKEREETARLRQEQVYKAQGIRRYKPLELKRGEVPLTVPQSPNFSDRFRL